MSQVVSTAASAALLGERVFADLRRETRQWHDRPHGRLRIQGLQPAARALCVASCHLALPARPSLVIAPSPRDAERMISDLRVFLGEDDAATPLQRRVSSLPGWETGIFEDRSPTREVVAARVEALYQLRYGRAPIVVTTPEALLLRVPSRDKVASAHSYLVEGDEVDRDELATRLTGWGFHRVSMVEDRGEFAVRGDIVDVFPAGYAQPIRIELFGDVVERLHYFDVVDQRLGAAIEEVLLLPVREFDVAAAADRDVRRAIEARLHELDVDRDERETILEGLAAATLFPGVERCLPYLEADLQTVADHLTDDTVVWLDAAGEIDSALDRIWADVERRAAERSDERRFFPPPEALYVHPTHWHRDSARRRVVELEALDMMSSDEHRKIAVRCYQTSDLRPEEGTKSSTGFTRVAARIRQWSDEGMQTVIMASSQARLQRLSGMLEHHALPVRVTNESFAQVPLAPGTVTAITGHLSEGFRLPDERTVLVSDADIFGAARRRAARRLSVAQLLKNLDALKSGDYVVHLDHGVGRYNGLRHLQVAGTEGDYLHLEYAGGDKLYLPVDRINLVQKYVGADGAAPALDKLGGTSWETTKKKTRESVLAMARELLAIYAARQLDERPAYGDADDLYREFEARFPFEETPDQRQAIEDTIADLAASKPMDRLVCGDVGYGKTEVALRAAFLAAMNGGQVAVLVPTTVLAHQHSETFAKRFAGYPVKIEMLSRFRSPAEIKATLEGLKKGSVDIVIGTHRLLQKDVEFKKLALLIIDEEHRFGVRHKERIKQMRTEVDVMALTATPIPRTLQMSLLGIRDLSVIETPPVDRLAIRTYVTRFDDDTIREAILRERARGGQVFFIHNRVENIDLMADHVRRLVPEARIGVAHGQMPEGQLEKVMLRFMHGEIDVLVCSAIVESGLDIPNANTIIINRADHFGLAQLYQLRGRVGRSHERAYAYLMIPGEHIISREAQKRLKVLQELDDLGGGFRLAAHDLEIRGAGNLLGKQQSGQITAVGFELYTQMLEEAVMDLRGQRRNVNVEPEIQLGFPAYIPESYIHDETQRVAFYRRLAEVRGRDEIDEIATEMRERFGPVPPLVDTFLRVMDLRRTLKVCMVVRANRIAGAVNLQFHPEAPVDVERLIEIARRAPERFKLSEDFQLRVRVVEQDWDGVVAEIQSVLQDLLQRPATAPAEAKTANE
jgi:transcription-repair coupling factor (superfamily II helicase)